jgi:uncharacterized phage protein (TIGR01671 family)
LEVKIKTTPPRVMRGGLKKMNMAREIKFRAWVSASATMVDLYKITPFALAEGVKTDGLFIPFSEQYALMQFTGLKDKKGVDIFEGDILKDHLGTGVVHFYPPQFVVQTEEETPFALAEGKVNMKQLEYTEIIGNIYENPELIK